MEPKQRLAVTVTPAPDVGGYVARAVDVGVASQGETEWTVLLSSLKG